MKTYSKYIIFNLVGPVFFISLTLTGIIWLVQSLKYIGLIVNQGLPMGVFLNLVILLLPFVLGLVLPVAALCAIIFIYNRMTYDSEIVVLKSAGVSLYGIATPAMKLLLLVVMIGYFFSLYLMPLTFREFKQQQVYLRDNYAALLLEEGVFSNPIDGITVYVGERAADSTLKGILVHDNRKPENPVTWMAKSGKVVRSGTSVRFLLENASSQQINRETGEVRTLYFDSYPFDISFYANDTTNRFRKKDERFLGELLFPKDELSEFDRAKFFAEGHERIIWPLYSLALPLLAIGIMLSGDFNRRGQQKRIITAIALSVVIIILGFATKNIVARGNIGLFPIMYLPVLSAYCYGIYCLFNTKSTKIAHKNNIPNNIAGAGN